MKVRKKYILIISILVLLLGSVVSLWNHNTYVTVEGDRYSKTSDILDMRGTEISIEYYSALSEALPDTDILWDVPFQELFYPEDTQQLTVNDITLEDIDVLKHFPALQTVEVTSCTNYDVLMTLQDTYPTLDILYTVQIDGQEYSWDTTEITVDSLSDTDIDRIRYLPLLETVNADGCDLNRSKVLQETFPDLRVIYSVPIHGVLFDQATTSLSLENANLSELMDAIWHMKELRSVSLTEPEGTSEELHELLDTYPYITFAWSRNVLGIPITSTDIEVDLSVTAPGSLEQVAEELAWFPCVETVYMFDLPFDHEAMASFRERNRAEYKVIWNVDIGPYILRSDATTFMPVKTGRHIFNNEAYNLRYCEDMVCIDLGHNFLTDCEWAQYMPHLKYLVLADTKITDIKPLGGLKELVFLEIFMTEVTDYSPLIGCTGLDDLNIGHTSGDGEPLKQMTWLKRLWWAKSPEDEIEYQEYLPNTVLQFDLHFSTGEGWRKGEHYYEMRDALGMPYMPSES